MAKGKIAVAMSGGVDSSVAALLLKEEGYGVRGFFMNLWSEVGENSAASRDSLASARAVAKKLDISLEVVDLPAEFKDEVVDYFIQEYAAGRTPNPCVVCNQKIKFGKLLEEAKKREYEFLATGHYTRLESRIKNQESGEKVYHLLRGKDLSKDQSYFLWRLIQDQLSRAVFPLGELAKEQVREIAREHDLPVAERRESQEICFVADSYREFLKRQVPGAIRSGPVLNTEGEEIGRHFGLPLYTIGQRHGFEVQSAVPLYVIRLDVENNTLMVGRGKDSEREEFEVEGTNWIGPTDDWPLATGHCLVQIRYQSKPVSARVEILDEDGARVLLDDPVRNVTPGQSAVFYRGGEVLGGGVISAVDSD